MCTLFVTFVAGVLVGWVLSALTQVLVEAKRKP